MIDGSWGRCLFPYRCVVSGSKVGTRAILYDRQTGRTVRETEDVFRNVGELKIIREVVFMKVWAEVDPSLNPALLGKTWFLPIGSGFQSPMANTKSWSALERLFNLHEARSGDVDQRPWNFRVDENEVSV
jgi:hypothetical protein